MKLRGHETFFIRKGWLSKGMKYVNQQPDVFTAKESDRKPMDVLGIGSNMVLSLRYWLQAVGLTTEYKGEKGKRIQKLTSFGELVFANDRYIEEIGTLYLLQYKLASNENLATSWYFFLNHFSVLEFTQEDFITDLQKYIISHTKEGEKETGTLNTLTDDFLCILGTYLPRKVSDKYEKFYPENNISCPFSELGLLVSLKNSMNKKKGLYKKAIPNSANFNPYVILAVIADRAKGKAEINLNELLIGDCNIGKVFNLDTITMIEVLRQAEKIYALKIIRTAGLDVVRLTHPEKNFLDYVRDFYESLENYAGERI